ncbi:MAG: hypothetical protein QG558_425, partial [Campylobacterota bacterium]|nr:hypothetical protein [Campylobacterota bacterium]
MKTSITISVSIALATILFSGCAPKGGAGMVE